MITGIDVASHQHPHGVGIGYSSVAADGIGFVSIKATEWRPTDEYRNPFWWQDVTGFRVTGIPTGSYLWFTPHDGVTQADFFCDMIGDLCLGDLRPMIDVEEEGVSGWELLRCVDRIYYRLGIEPFLYGGANPRFHKPLIQCVEEVPELVDTALWVASYGFTIDHGPGDCGPWDESRGGPGWAVWQQTSSGVVNGIQSLVDVDYMQADLADHRFGFSSPTVPITPDLKVKKMYEPSLPVDIVASCPGPGGLGVLLLQSDGAVFVFHAPVTVPTGWLIGANGQEFFAGREAADIALNYDGNGEWEGTWTITATSGETYTFPADPNL